MAKQEVKKIKTDSGIPVKRSFSSKDLTSISMMMKKQANIRIQEVYTLTCIEKDSGLCGSIVALGVQKKLTIDFDFY